MFWLFPQVRSHFFLTRTLKSTPVHAVFLLDSGSRAGDPADSETSCWSFNWGQAAPRESGTHCLLHSFLSDWYHGYWNKEDCGILVPGAPPPPMSDSHQSCHIVPSFFCLSSLPLEIITLRTHPLGYIPWHMLVKLMCMAAFSGYHQVISVYGQFWDSICP